MDSYEQAKAYALKKTGLDWAKRDKWRDQDRTAYLAANAEFRQSNPHLFSAAQLAAAANYASTAATAAPSFSYTGEFLKEAGNQIKGLNDDLNPFAESNRGKTRATIIVAILLAAMAYFGVLAWRTSPRNPSPSPPGGADLFRTKPAARRRKKEA